jgi:predicted DNA-binding transcriptional regulator AlpA
MSPLFRFDDLPNDALLRVAQVAALVGVSVPTIWRRVASGDFPDPIRIPPRQTAWRVGAVRAYLANPPRTGEFARPVSPGRKPAVRQTGRS